MLCTKHFIFKGAFKEANCSRQTENSTNMSWNELMETMVLQLPEKKDKYSSLNLDPAKLTMHIMLSQL